VCPVGPSCPCCRCIYLHLLLNSRFGPTTRATRRAGNEGLSRSAVTAAEDRELVAGPIAAPSERVAALSKGPQ
jgi:hypothetical protein